MGWDQHPTLSEHHRLISVRMILLLIAKEFAASMQRILRGQERCLVDPHLIVTSNTSVHLLRWLVRLGSSPGSRDRHFTRILWRQALGSWSCSVVRILRSWILRRGHRRVRTE